MTPPANIIRQYLLDLNLGTESGVWPIFVGFLPGQPDSALCVYDTEGRLDGRIMASGRRISHLGIQVMIRGVTYPTAWEKAANIALAFDQARRSIVVLAGEPSYVLDNISRTSDIMPLGLEQEGSKRRQLFSVNAVVTLRQRTGLTADSSLVSADSTLYTADYEYPNY